MPISITSFLTGLLFLHVIAMHASIAAMEILSWLIFVTVVAVKLVKRQRFHFPLWIPLLGLTATVAISLVANPSLRPFLLQFGFMRWIFLLWGFLWTFELIWESKFERRLLQVWIGAVVVSGFYAAFQCLTGLDPVHPRSSLIELNGAYRATGFFSLTLTYAYVVGTSYLALFLSSARAGSRRWQWTLWLMGLVAVAATVSRGAWLGLIAAGLAYLCLYARKWLPYFVAGTCSLLIAMSFVSKELNETLHGRLEHSSSERVNLWKAYLQMFFDHPFTGVGIFQGDKLLPEYYQRLGIEETFMSHAHNVPIQWVAGAGIFSLIFYGWISIYFLVAAWRLAKTSPWGGSLLMAQVYWHAGSLTEANFFDGEVTHMIVFTWAILLYLTISKTKVDAPTLA